MATFGDHPPLPESLEALLADTTVSTLFLKADCPPRIKAGHITDLRLEELSIDAWDKIANYTEPKLKAVEVSSDDQGLTVSIQRKRFDGNKESIDTEQ